MNGTTSPGHKEAFMGKEKDFTVAMDSLFLKLEKEPANGVAASRVPISCLLGLFSAVVGIAVLVGWWLDIPSLKSVLPGFVTMKANTAVGFILAGLSLVLAGRGVRSMPARRVSQVCSGATALMGLLTLSQYLSGLDFGIDQLLFREPAGAVGTLNPGRMASMTAVNFLLLGCALLLAPSRRAIRATQGLALLAGLMALLPLMGYLYGAPMLIGVGHYTHMAVHAAMLFIFLSTGVLFLRPAEGFMGAVTGNTIGGWLVRRTVPLVIGVPLALGWLRVKGERHGLFEREFGVAMMMVVMMVILTGLIYWAARALSRIHDERRRATHDMQASETRYRRLFETAKDGVLIMDADTGKIVDANPFLTDLLGYTHAELLGKHLWEIGLSKDIAVSKEAFLELVAKGYIRYESLPLKTRDGRAIDVEFVSNAYQVNSTSVIQCNIRDITDRKKAQMALQESEAKYRALFEASADGILIAETGKKVFGYANPAMCRMLGYSEKELSTMGVADIHPKDDLPRLIAEFEAQARGEKTLVAGVPCLRKDGTTVFADVNSAMAVIGGSQCMVGFFRDITERNRSAAELTASETRYRSLFVSSGDALMTLEPPSWTFTSGNPATVQIFGVKDEADFVSRGPPELSPEKQPDGRASGEKAMEMIETAMREGSHSFEWTHKRVDGREFPATVLLTRVELAGRPLLQATVRDVTESRRSIDAMKRSEAALRQLSEAKTQFVAHASHELRTPLAIIRQFVHLLDSGIAGTLAAKQKECTVAALRNCDRLAELINRMLDLARIEAGKVHIDHSRIEPGILLRQAYTDFVPKMATKKQSLVLDAPDGLPAVNCDPQTITSVIMELLGNAHKYTPAGGKITLGCRQEKEFVSVYVQDDGPGIRPEDQERIFEAFAQVDRQDGPGAKGTGLGLTIIREIVKLNGGTVSVDSTPGKGSRFSFTLPVFGPETQAISRVLVVDDDKNAVELITRNLELSGLKLEIKTASTGLQALVIAGTFHPQLVILDFYLPDSSTTDVFGSLGEESAGRHGKILMISADEGVLRKMVRQGADDYLVKPFSASQLREKVVTLLGLRIAD